MVYIKGIDRNQTQMFPEIIDDYIDEENSVKVIDSFVDSLNTRELGSTKCEKKGLEHHHIIQKTF